MNCEIFTMKPAEIAKEIIYTKKRVMVFPDVTTTNKVREALNRRGYRVDMIVLGVSDGVLYALKKYIAGKD